MEGQLKAWMDAFHAFLGLQEVPALAEADPTKEAPLDGLKVRGQRAFGGGVGGGSARGKQAPGPAHALA